jgi:hypothetical protein
VVTVLFKAGDQVPVMPFNEVVGNGASKVPAQTGAGILNAGTIKPGEVMVTVALLVQPLASLTVIPYEPAASPVKTELL